MLLYLCFVFKKTKESKWEFIVLIDLGLVHFLKLGFLEENYYTSVFFPYPCSIENQKPPRFRALCIIYSLIFQVFKPSISSILTRSLLAIVCFVSIFPR